MQKQIRTLSTQPKDKLNYVKAYRVQTPAERFAAKTIRIASGCVLWTGCTDKDGYGKIQYGSGHGSIYTRAHRVSYELAYGAFDSSLHVLHTCDNPTCVNPEHLFLGTNTDNMRDMASKYRGKHHVVTPPLSWVIRRLRVDGLTYRQIAARVGVSATTVLTWLRKEQSNGTELHEEV